MKKMIDTLDEDIAAFEVETGKAVSPTLRRLCADLMIACDRFTELGVKDAAGGKPQREREVFIRWCQGKASGTIEENKPIVDLIYGSYIKGFDNGGVCNAFSRDN